MLLWIKSSLVVYFLNTCGGADVTYAVNFLLRQKVTRNKLPPLAHQRDPPRRFLARNRQAHNINPTG